MITSLASWSVTHLGELVEVLDFARIPVSAPQRAKRLGSVPYYGAAGQVGWIDKALFDEPLVLLGEDGVQFFDCTKSKAYPISGPAWVNNHAHVLRARPAIERRYLLHFLNNFDYRGFANGTTRLKLTQAAMRRMPIYYPDLDEQRRIVDILEDHLSRLDDAAKSVEAANRRLIALRRSVLSALFSGDGYARVSLREFVTCIETGRSFGGSSHPAADDEWGIIKVSAMTWGRFRAEKNKAIASDRADARYEIHKGDLLVSRANTTAYVGASVLVGEVRPRLLLSDKSLRIITAPDVERQWLWRALSTPVARSQMSAAATGTKDSMRNISQASLLNIELPSVPPADQKAAVARSLEVETGIERLTAQLNAAAARGERLRHALLGAAFSGRLTGRASDLDVVEELSVGAL